MAVTLPTVGYDWVCDAFEGEPDELGRKSYVESKIRHTVGKLKTRFGQRIESRLAAGLLDEDLFKDTVAEAVLRIIRNPEGYTTEQQGNYSYGLRAVVASGYLMFTAENMLDLLGEDSPVIGTFAIGDHRGA
ncbi:Gp19/Gp15/Gp42 family protein [Leucobacter musarum]|uniref:Gp19/Gp15/Gp42 family protein n=1 Tax=Leucobacter musarum TaxID=1930747 RepID=UPI0006A76897|nr:Gp19/Gp15/Gp42 family protein [Leucobacter musarum]